MNLSDLWQKSPTNLQNSLKKLAMFRKRVPSDLISHIASEFVGFLQKSPTSLKNSSIYVAMFRERVPSESTSHITYKFVGSLAKEPHKSAKQPYKISHIIAHGTGNEFRAN